MRIDVSMCRRHGRATFPELTRSASMDLRNRSVSLTWFGTDLRSRTARSSRRAGFPDGAVGTPCVMCWVLAQKSITRVAERGCVAEAATQMQIVQTTTDDCR